jgi:hypothetical protein
LLDFDEQIAGARGVNTAGGEEDRVALVNSNRLKAIDHSSVA